MKRLVVFAVNVLACVGDRLLRTIPDPVFPITTEADDAEDREFHAIISEDIEEEADRVEWPEFEAFQTERWGVTP